MGFWRPFRSFAAASRQAKKGDTRPPSGTERAADAERAVSVLRKHWGYPAFRSGQLDIITELLSGRDVLAILPTGGGKSLCFQVPALVAGGVTVVVSPLISLMEDQVRALVARGIPAWNVSGRLSAGEINAVVDAAGSEPAALVYVAPERLASVRFRSALAGLPIRFLAVDEAHCISEWGHEFRPSYRRIPEAYVALGRPTVIALTATATPRVRDDIAAALDLRAPATFAGGVDRPAIIFSVLRTPAKRTMLVEILRRVPGPALVYAPTRKSVEAWTERLTVAGMSARRYHAGLATEERSDAQLAWQNDRVRIIVATSAFGMGIDKPDVRSVTHVGLSYSLEGYYQEAGRAGRDGGKSYATLLFDGNDVDGHRELIRRCSSGPLAGLRSRLRLGAGRSDERLRLKGMLSYALATTCRRRRLLGHFGEYTFGDCGACDVCLGRHRSFTPGPRSERNLIRVLETLEKTSDRMDALDPIPLYRLRQYIDWLSRHGYVQQGDDLGLAARLTPLGNRILARAAREGRARDRTA